MPRKPEKLRQDVSETAYRVVQAATGQGERAPQPSGRQRNPLAASRGRKGGKKGGPARARRLTATRRTEIAKTAAAARWKKKHN